MSFCPEGSGKSLQDIPESGDAGEANVGAHEMGHGGYCRVKNAIDFEYSATYGLDKVRIVSQ